MSSIYLENVIPVAQYEGIQTAKNVTLSGSNNFDASGSTGTFKTSTGANTIGGALSMASGKAITPSSGGIVPITAPSGIANWQPVAATSGTDTTPANNTQFLTTMFIPANKTITNINYLIGSVGGTDKVYGALYDSTGAALANTSVSGGG